LAHVLPVDLELARDSRPAAGAVVGVTLAAAPGDARVRVAIEAAYAAVERFEAELSEWRPSSMTSVLMVAGVATFSPEARELFAVAEGARLASGGAFDVGWAGGRAWLDGSVVRAEGRIGLGAILKGFLADRAADAVRAAGIADVVVDAAGDVVARGSAPGQRGWPVTAQAGGLTWTLRLRDAAISTTAEDQQPGHVVDARTGEPARCLRAATVVAPDGVHADAYATALFSSCGRAVLPPGARARWVDAEGRQHRARGAPRT
jgi:thiamine biosynthesis lipoprotein